MTAARSNTQKLTVMEAGPAPAETVTVRSIALTRLRPASWNARKTRDEAAMHQLVDSIARHGVQVPLIVRIEDDVSGRYEIVCGHRRFDALLRAKGSDAEAPCIVRILDDAEAREVALVDNLQREGVPVIEEAEALGELMKRPGATIETLAAAVGKAAAYVGRRLKLLDLILPAREALKAAAIEVGHALELARLTPVQQARFLDNLNCGYSAPRKSGSIIEAELGKSAAKVKWSPTPQTVAGFRREIANSELRVLADAPFSLESASLPPMPCTECPKRSGNAALLFADLAQDTCTDRACFDRKVQACIAEQLEAARKEKRVLLKLSSGYSDEKGVLRSYEVKEVKDNACSHADEAIWINGAEAGHRILICRGGDCKKHGRESYSSTPAKDSGERKKKLAQVNAEKKYRAALFAAVAKAPVPAARAQDLNLEVCLYAIGRAPGGYNNKTAEALGWPAKVFSWDGSKALRELLAKLGPAERLRASLVSAHSGEVGVNDFSSTSKADDLEKLAGLLGLDIKKIRAGVGEKANTAPAKTKKTAKSTLSSAARKRIAAAQKKRWASRKKAGRK